MTDLSNLTIWVNRHGRPCDADRHDARKLEVVPKERCDYTHERDMEYIREVEARSEDLVTAMQALYEFVRNPASLPFSAVLTMNGIVRAALKRSSVETDEEGHA